LLPDAVVTTCPAFAPLRTGDVVILVPALKPLALLTIPVREPSAFCLNFVSTDMVSFAASLGAPKKEKPPAFSFFGSAFLIAMVPERRAGAFFAIGFFATAAFFAGAAFLAAEEEAGEAPKKDNGFGAGGAGAGAGAGGALGLPKKEKGAGADFGAGAGAAFGAAFGAGLPKKENGAGAAFGAGAGAAFGAAFGAGLPKNENGAGAAFLAAGAAFGATLGAALGAGFGALKKLNAGGAGTLLATGFGAAFGAALGAAFCAAFGAAGPLKKENGAGTGFLAAAFGAGDGFGAAAFRAGFGVAGAGEENKLKAGAAFFFGSGVAGLKRLTSTSKPLDFFAGGGAGLAVNACNIDLTFLGGGGGGALRAAISACLASHSLAFARAICAASSSNFLRFATWAASFSFVALTCFREKLVNHSYIKHFNVGFTGFECTYCSNSGGLVLLTELLSSRILSTLACLTILFVSFPFFFGGHRGELCLGGQCSLLFFGSCEFRLGGSFGLFVSFGLCL
jgi:hypothetical protein